MSDQDQDSSQWQLGMQLPSRKETHGRKKKSDRKLEEPKPVPKPAPKPASKQKKVRYVEAIPEDPQYAAAPVPKEQQDAIQQLQAYWNESAATAAPPMEESAELSDEQYLRELLVNPDKLQEVLDLHRAEVPVANQEAVAEQPAEAVEELSPVSIEQGVPEVPLGTTDLTQQAEPLRMASEANRAPDKVLDPADATWNADPTTAMDATPDVATDTSADEEETAPVISKWKIALLLLLTPIVLVIVLAWGKLAYVHRVPGFVQQEVPAYQQGQGFLILKPWWFGPPIFTLDQYERTDGEDFAHWSIQLNDYSAVVDDPTVLYTFPEDILK